MLLVVLSTLVLAEVVCLGLMALAFPRSAEVSCCVGSCRFLSTSGFDDLSRTTLVLSLLQIFKLNLNGGLNTTWRRAFSPERRFVALLEGLVFRAPLATCLLVLSVRPSGMDLDLGMAVGCGELSSHFCTLDKASESLTGEAGCFCMEL